MRREPIGDRLICLRTSPYFLYSCCCSNPTPGARGYGVSWRRYGDADRAFLSLVADASQPMPMRSYSPPAEAEARDRDAQGTDPLQAEARLARDAGDARAAQLWNAFLPRLHNDSIGPRVAGWAASREAPLTNGKLLILTSDAEKKYP